MGRKRLILFLPVILIALLISVPVVMAKPTMAVLWSLSGNSGTNPGPDFLGTSDDKDLVIKTNSMERMRIKNTGGDGDVLPGMDGSQDFGSSAFRWKDVYASNSFIAGATTTYADGSITQATGSGLNIDLGGAGGDDFTVETSAFVVESDGGNVGIGTAAPGVALDVGAADNVSVDLSVDTDLAVDGDTTLGNGTGDDTSISGDLTVGDDTTLGQSSGDKVIFNAGVDSDILPLGMYDLGRPSQRWQDIFTSGDVDVLGGVSVEGDLNVDTNTTLGDDFTDILTIGGTIVNIPNDLNIDGATLFIDSDLNRVGIGDPTPDARLEVKTTTGDAIRATTTSTGVDTAVFGTATGPAGSVGIHGLATNGTAVIAQTSSGFAFVALATGGGILFKGGNKFVVENDGRTGIGTVSPSSTAMLDVVNQTSDQQAIMGTAGSGTVATGVLGDADQGFGVLGTTLTGNGVRGAPWAPAPAWWVYPQAGIFL